MINNLQKFIQNLEISKTNAGMYVHFYSENGKIIKISSKEESLDNAHSIFVDYGDIKDIQEGVRSLDDYLVTFDPIKNKLVVTNQLEQVKIPNVRDRLYKIPYTNPNADITVTHRNGDWLVSLAQEKRVAEEAVRHHFNFNLIMYFSITEKNNPNILHSLCKVTYQSLMAETEVDITDQIVTDINPNNVSIYTAKYFDSYNFEVEK